MEQVVIDMKRVTSVQVGGVWLPVEPGTISTNILLVDGDASTQASGMTAFRERGLDRWVVVKDAAVEAWTID